MRFLYYLSFFILAFFASFLQHPVPINGANSSRPPLTQIPQDLYHSSDELLKEVSSLVGRHPDTLTMETMRAGNRGYFAQILVTTFDRAKTKKPDSLKFRILLSFGQHGRELITSELALHLLAVLTGELRIRGMNMDSFNSILDNIVIKVVPMENLNGRKLVEAGDLCERRNGWKTSVFSTKKMNKTHPNTFFCQFVEFPFFAGRGVDLNRIWSVDWGKKEKDYDSYEENPGVAPFSEPEAQLMREITRSFDPHIWVTVHSGMEALFMPYDHKNGTPEGFTSKLMKSVLVDLNHHHFHDRYVVGSGGGAVGYFAHGTTTDYMYDVARVPVSFTFEIYGDDSAGPNDCFRMFNPVDAATFKRVLSEWSKAFLELFVTGPDQLKKAEELGRWVSIGGNVMDGSLVGENRGSRNMMDGLELGMQELRTYYRLFLLSSVLLLFMFCSRISKSKLLQANASILS